MSRRTPQLQLTWLGKDERPTAAPQHHLQEQPRHAHQRGNGIIDNRLIHGDNLFTLAALAADFSGRIRCIFIDPPYNTGKTFAHYDDDITHARWLSRIRDRIAACVPLLAEDGSVWIAIDDHQCHYLKVLCDEIFGRANFVASFVWEKDQGRRGDTDISRAHDHVLLYTKNRALWRKHRNLLARTPRHNSRYRNPDNDPRGPWLQGDNGTAKSGREANRFAVTLPSGRIVRPPRGNYWRFSRQTLSQARAENRVWFGRNGDRLPVIKRYHTHVQDGIVPRTWWPAAETGSNQSAKRDHLRRLLPEIEPFATPKPEQLLARILTIASNPGDWVLDPFAGSGTTGAAAHKMGRRWIMIELGDHCFSHLIPRLRKVIDGDDPFGITTAVRWQGGGGFQFFELCTDAP